MLSILNNEDISLLDKQIEQLIDFKPIPEHEVKGLCEKVMPLINLLGQGDSLERDERAARALPSDCLRRHPRPIP
jgi:hypothetical protein